MTGSSVTPDSILIDPCDASSARNVGGPQAGVNMVGGALTYWDSIRSTRELPARGDLPAPWGAAPHRIQATVDFWPNAFLIEALSVDAWRLVGWGAALDSFANGGRETNGNAFQHPDMAQEIVGLAEATATMRRPLSQTGLLCVWDAMSDDLLYRCMALPLGGAEGVTHILGCLSFQSVALAGSRG